MSRITLTLAGLCLACGLTFAAPLANAQEATSARDAVVDGDMWLASSPEIRKAFLIGAGNMIAMEVAYAQRRSQAVSPASERTRQAVANLSLDQLSDRVTRWYQANPERHDVPVMGVIWFDVVRAGNPTAH